MKVKNKTMNHSETIISTASQYFGIPVDLLAAKTRKREVVVCRHVAMLMLKEFTQMSLKSIGQCFGGRDHASVIHALQSMEDLEDQDRGFADRLYLLKELIAQKIYPIRYISAPGEEQIDKEFEHLLP